VMVWWRRTFALDWSDIVMYLDFAVLCCMLALCTEIHSNSQARSGPSCSRLCELRVAVRVWWWNIALR
jgi:hypothetical protein